MKYRQQRQQREMSAKEKPEISQEIPSASTSVPTYRLTGKQPLKRPYDPLPEEIQEKQQERMPQRKREYEETEEDLAEEHQARTCKMEDLSAVPLDLRTLMLLLELAPKKQTDQERAVAEEPEPFVGEEGGYDESWKELPLQEVLAGRKAELKSIASFKVVRNEIEESAVPEPKAATISDLQFQIDQTNIKIDAVLLELAKVA